MRRVPARRRHAALLAALVAAGCTGLGTGLPRGTTAPADTQRLTGPGARAPETGPDTATRARPDSVPGLALVLNVPAMRLDAFGDGRPLRSWDAGVGERSHPTPLGSFWISDVTWNPSWVPPRSEWAAGQPPMPPGPANPMGRVKLRFLDSYYLHGTPLEESVGQAASHGCVRLRNADAIELALLVHRYAGRPLPPVELEQLLANPTATRTFLLTTPVPFQIVYRLAEVRAGQLLLHPDLYGRGGPTRGDALAALGEAGYTRARLATGRLDELLARVRRGRLAVPVDSLLYPAAGPQRR